NTEEWRKKRSEGLDVPSVFCPAVTFNQFGFFAILALLAISLSPLPPFLCVSKVFGLFGFCHKLSSLNLSCSLYLHKDTIVARLGKTIRKRNLCRRRSMVHVRHDCIG